MKRQDLIQQEVQKTLQCFEQEDTIKSSPNFYARLMGKIKQLEQKKNFSFSWVFNRKALRPVFIVTLLALNIFSTAFFLLRSGYRQDVREKYISKMADEYTLDMSQYYLYYK